MTGNVLGDLDIHQDGEESSHNDICCGNAVFNTLVKDVKHNSIKLKKIEVLEF